jgi:hypothetical protein
MPNPNPVFTGFPYGISAPGLGMMAMTPSIGLPQTTTHTIFTIAGGPILVNLIFGYCTTAVGAVANATKLEFVDTITSTATALCGTADVNALVAGNLFVLVNAFATAATITSPATVGILNVGSALATSPINFIATPGVIRINCAGSDGGAGQMQWFMNYAPLGVGVSQAGLVTVTAALS